MALQERIFTVGKVGDTQYNRFALELVLTEESVSNTRNTSQISYTLDLVSGSKRFSGYGLGAEISLGGEVVARRDQQSEPQLSIAANSTLTILTGTVTVPHNADGTLDMPVAFWINTPVEEYTPGYMALTDGSMALTPIPRQSRIQATPADIGKASTLTITRHSAAYTHSVWYHFGDQMGYVSEKGIPVDTEEIFSATDVSFLLPESFYDEIPNAKTGVGTLVITTYADGTAIGTDSTPFTAMTDPDQCRPEILAFSAVDSNELTVALTGDEHTFIRGASIARCQVDARGQKGASIRSVKINGAEALEFTADREVLELTVTDSRGYPASQSLPLTMIPYVKLTCHPSVKRLTPTGEQVLLQVEGQHYAGDAFSNQLRISCGLPDGTWQDIPCTHTGNDYRGQLLLEDVPYTQDYTVTVDAADEVMSLHDQILIKQVIPVFDWGQNDFIFHVPVTFAAGQTTLRYGQAPADFDPDGVTDSSLLWCYEESDPTKNGLWLTFAPYPGNIAFQLYCKPDGTGLQYRTRWNYEWYQWRDLG